MSDRHLKTYIALLTAFAILLFSSWYYWYSFSFDLELLVGACILSALIIIGLAFPIKTGQ